MARYKKTYGVTDYMHWNAVIPCKQGIKLHCEFTDGSASVNGVVPATYTTVNPIHQALIESSDFFKRGKIKLIRTIALKDPAIPASSETPKKEEKKEETSKEEVKTLDETPKGEVKKDDKGYTLVEVSDIERDGRQYLCDNFGCDAKSLRTKAVINSVASRHKIKFVLPTD